MPKYKILHVIGARPHFMKLAPLSRAIAGSEDFEEVIVHTEQHYTDELSQAFIREFELKEPDYRLGVGSGSHLRQVGQIILALEKVFDEVRPDIVFVYGDTNSTAAGAIAAAKSHIPLAHIEAGLREWNKQIPEEINKLLIDAVADLLFCPTQVAVDNLARTGVTQNVHLVGDTVIDLISQNGHSKLKDAEVMKELETEMHGYYLLTCHRASNTNDRHHLQNILKAAAALDKKVIFPVHPRTQAAILEYGLNDLISGSNIVRTGPVGFRETQALIRNASGVLTDSGGIIKEAYFHRVPCFILDRQTEWIEAVEERWAVVTGPDTNAIEKAIREWQTPASHSNHLGDGHASERILGHTRSFLGGRKAKA